MVDKYYKPGEPEGRPYFFYYVVPQPWSSGGWEEIVDALTDPHTLNPSSVKGRFYNFWREGIANFKKPICGRSQVC